MGNLIVTIVLIAMVAFIVSGIVKDHKNGKHLCGGDCGSCGHCRGSGCMNNAGNPNIKG
ncbi:MAG: FeoB-associated Cys-rich membrane protein [Eubacteriales bacterium]|nr:FeoB-associated Cys-rich membrane protein [Eubacteriales bacterium]